MTRNNLITRLVDRKLGSNNGANAALCIMAPRAAFCMPAARTKFCLSAARAALCIGAARTPTQKS